MKKILGILFICIHSLYASAQNWEAVGLGAYAINSGVEKLYSDTVNNLLYGTGSFKTSTGDTIFGMAKWDGIKWDSLGAGLPSNSRLEAVTMYNGELYISGTLTSAGGIEVNGMARWDGVSWDSVAGGGAGVALYTYNNELYGGGGFIFTNGVYSPIGKWDGVKWDSVGSPSTYPWISFGTIWAFGDFNGELFIGGVLVSGFTNEGIPKAGISKFDGTTWEGLLPHGVHGNGPSCQSPVNVFIEYDNQLYIGGCFNQSFAPWPNVGNNIVRWEGDSLQDVGGGVNEIITDFAVFNNELYVVGSFWEAGGVSAQSIAKWNGTEWCGLGSQFNGDVASIEVHNNELYIGGFFTTIDGESISRVAKWIGGNFTDTCGVLVSVEDLRMANAEYGIYPNPTTGQITLTNLPQETTRITIYNVLGELLYEVELNGSGEPTIDLSKFPDGLFLVQLQPGHTLLQKKVIKQ